MKRGFILLLLTMAIASFSIGQKVSDATMGIYNNTYIRPGITEGVRAANHNMMNKYIIASKMHKDSLQLSYDSLTHTIDINSVSSIVLPIYQLTSNRYGIVGGPTSFTGDEYYNVNGNWSIPPSHWDTTGDDLSNTNAGDLIFISDTIKAPNLKTPTGKFSKIIGYDTYGRIFPQPLSEFYDTLMVYAQDSGSVYLLWEKDTANGYVFPATLTDKVGLGTETPNEQLEITGNFRLPASTATTGLIKKGSATWLSDFSASGTTGNNIWLGLSNGNTSLTGSTTGDQGSYNLFFGNHIGQSITTGYGNIAVGHYPLFGITTGRNNIAIGNASLQQADTAKGNVALGFYTLRLNKKDYNTAIGYNSQAANTTGYDNTSVGAYSLDAGGTPYQMTAIGRGALGSVTYGYASTAVGIDAMAFTDTSITNVAVGNSALSYSKGACNVAVGNSTLKIAVYGIDNVAVGSGAMQHAKATALYGLPTPTPTGSENVGIGCYAADSINYSGEAEGTGVGNIIIGQYAMRRGRTINKNVAIGFYSGYNNIVGDSNVYLGNQTGYNATGSHNVFIGDRAGYNETGNYKSVWAADSTQWANGMATASKMLFYADQSNADKANHFMNIFAKVAIGEAKALSAYELEVVGDVNVTGDLQIGGEAYYDGVVANTITAEATTVNWTLGNIQSLALSDTVTVTFTAPTGPCHLTLKITHADNTTDFPITWPAAVLWPGGVAIDPTDSNNAVDIVSFLYDGTNYFGMYGNDFQ